MPARVTDPAGAPRHALSLRGLPPGQIGLAVVAVSVVLAAVVRLSGDGQTYWLCVPVGLIASSWCASPRSGALAVAAVMASAGAPALAAGQSRPAVWLAVVVPAAAALVAHRTRGRVVAERDALRDFALTDPLTRVANRRALLAQAQHEAARHHRAQESFALMMLDLDGFKAINDRFGHGAGDELLRDVALAMQSAMRAQDLVARLGGDEFCVLAPDTDAEGATRLAGRVAAAVRTVTAGSRTVRASVGTAVFPEDGAGPAELLEVADARLLAAKRELYRNRDRTERPRRAAA